MARHDAHDAVAWLREEGALHGVAPAAADPATATPANNGSATKVDAAAASASAASSVKIDVRKLVTQGQDLMRKGKDSPPHLISAKEIALDYTPPPTAEAEEVRLRTGAN